MRFTCLHLLMLSIISVPSLEYLFSSLDYYFSDIVVARQRGPFVGACPVPLWQACWERACKPRLVEVWMRLKVLKQVAMR